MKPTPGMSRLLFYPTLAWTLLKTRVLRSEQHWTVIDEALILGALPCLRELARFEELSVGGVINMCAEWNGNMPRYESLGIEQLHLPTPDFHSPDLDAVKRGVEFIASHADRGQRVYCHCKAGRGRSATIAVGWLMSSAGMSPEEAESHLVEKRSQVNRRLASRQAVRDFAATLTAASS
ncbi:MAG: dual specificity protein phosphatase family protein [Planctomycetes bacterium]|nr:dual specificity protein phosphatase family protein [Planctomycetota bacterium]